MCWPLWEWAREPGAAFCLHSGALEWEAPSPAVPLKHMLLGAEEKTRPPNTLRNHTRESQGATLEAKGRGLHLGATTALGCPPWGWGACFLCKPSWLHQAGRRGELRG